MSFKIYVQILRDFNGECSFLKEIYQQYKIRELKLKIDKRLYF
jgi:hypothetical protein